MNLGRKTDNTVIINILYDHGSKKRSQKAGNLKFSTKLLLFLIFLFTHLICWCSFCLVIGLANFSENDPIVIIL